MPKSQVTDQVSFDVSKKDHELILAIAKRANAGVDTIMDLTACHANGCPLDLEKLLKAPEYTFWHDLGGIARLIDRSTGKVDKTFCPRCHA